MFTANENFKQNPSSKEFVKVIGTSFVLNDKNLYVVGANYWQAMNLGMSNKTRVLKDLEVLKKHGINCVRIMAGSEGPDGEPYRMRPALMNSPGVYNEEVFQGLDWFLDQLRKYDITAIMTLSNYWHWSGGFAQYVNWIDKTTPIPYPKWGSEFLDFEEYAARFYSDEKIQKECQQLYLNHVETVINRRNMINGEFYRDDPVIFAWELANEPQPPIYQGTNDKHHHEIFFNWIDSTANFIKSLDPNHLVSTGVEGKHGKDWFITSHRSKHIDFTSAHVWVENWGYYNSSDPSEENYQKAENFMIEFLENTSDWSTNISNKPILLGEFGMARDGWKDISKYDPRATTKNKDRYFKAIADKVLQLEKQKRFSGLAFWAFAGLARPTDSIPQWLGDPPHEPPGWYSVYDTDQSTLNIFAEHARNVDLIE
ncbi:24164_t:CDS:2 [Entrophospora sp. SA101]|nr:13334_t:CDS:2 [Entrophospora sp. SA101]CAJ0759824.1 24164_t:CDS:2 [Entrophospora sp. SA101]CAJ0871697.1 6832_t:CDS:2 [Entrophospora sp. SA101]